MASLEGKVVAITGAGRGLGRAHALAFAAEGAKVVVNDLGVGPDGAGASASPAEEVAAEIRAAGGEAVTLTGDIATASGAASLVDCALDTYGRLDTLVPVAVAQALHAAAPEPRTILWYEAGHGLDQQASLDRLDWLHQEIGLDARP